MARERLGGLRGGEAAGINTLFPLHCCGWGLEKVENSHMSREVFIICLDLKERPLQVTKLLKTARLGVW